MILIISRVWTEQRNQGLVKGAKLCFRYSYFYFQHGESTSIASQQTSSASQLSKDLNKVPLLLQNLALYSFLALYCSYYKTVLTKSLKFHYPTYNLYLKTNALTWTTRPVIYWKSLKDWSGSYKIKDMPDIDNQHPTKYAK